MLVFLAVCWPQLLIEASVDVLKKLLSLERSSAGQIKRVPVKAELALQVHPLDDVLSVFVDVVAADEMCGDIPAQASKRVIQDCCQHVVRPARLVMFHLADTELPHPVAEQAEAHGSEQCEAAVHVRRSLNIMVLLNGDRSEAVEVELGKLLRHEKLAL